MRGTRDNALALMVVLALAMVFINFNPLGVAKPLEDIEVVDCDGRTIMLDGRKPELRCANAEVRADHGVGQLCIQENLIAAAQAHAENMIRRDVYAHETPEGLTPGDRITRAGYQFAIYGENINRVSGSYSGEPDRGELRERWRVGWRVRAIVRIS